MQTIRSYISSYRAGIILAVGMLMGVTVSTAQTIRPTYSVLSSNESEFVVEIIPQYEYSAVRGENGESYTLITVEGGSTSSLTAGTPSLPVMQYLFLTPTANVLPAEIVSVEYDTPEHLQLAPVPTFVKDGDMLRTVYRISEAFTPQSASTAMIASIAAGTMRTAYIGELQFTPMRYDGLTSTLVKVKRIIIRQRFESNKYFSVRTISSSEREFFTTTFLNGNIEKFYSSAKSVIARPTSAVKSSVSPQASEIWLSVKTTDEGVYRITASQLSSLGIGTVDPRTIALFGYGGNALPETVTAETGELKEAAIDVRTDGSGNFSELRFFAAGTAKWAYRKEFSSSRYFGLYHILNPYSSHGRYLLRIGGTANGKRIGQGYDSLRSAPVIKQTVQAVSLYENELEFEVPNKSRDFIGERIRQGASVSVPVGPLPGYTPEETMIRPAVNSKSTDASHQFTVTLDGNALGIIPGSALSSNDDRYITRQWGTELFVSGSTNTPQSINLAVSTTDKTGQFWLNFVETFYRRSTNLAEGQIPFLLFADTAAYRYTFSNASGAEVWDVTDQHTIRRMASASGSDMSVDLQGPGEQLRRFVAFSAANVRTPELSTTSAMPLRASVEDNTAVLYIVAPEAFSEPAKRYAELRRRGGQATEPLTVKLVMLEDIYREFGYGQRDPIALRDFLAYAFRHTTANGAVVPMFVSLFGGGHLDYQNRKTQLQNVMPIWLTYDFGSVTVMRRDYPDNIPDDAFFTMLTPNSTRMDMAIGRIPVNTISDAENFYRKLEKYETASDEGFWRARTTFIADDRYYEGINRSDGIDHLYDSENEVKGVDKRLIVDKLYSHSFPTLFTSGGRRRKPELEKAIVDAFNNGSALISFVGHGNPEVWTNESILTVPSTINKFSNFDRLTFLTTATCDFSEFDDYAVNSGGVQIMNKADGGAIGSLATSRSVYPNESLVFEFFRKLFTVPCDAKQGSNYIGVAYQAGRAYTGSTYSNPKKFLILGDPAQRLLIPRQYVFVDSINTESYRDSGERHQLRSLQQVRITGHIADNCDGTAIDASFSGTTTVTLFDAQSLVTQTTTFTQAQSITDKWMVEGPILYRGKATVRSGHFSITFIVPKDIKFDTSRAKLHFLAYSDDFRSALGAAANIVVNGVDSSRTKDIDGPAVAIYIGSRRFRSGDIVPKNTKVIVDVSDESGVNTSTASIGHSFIGWTNDNTDNIIDLAENYSSVQDDYRTGSTYQQTVLPEGRGVLNVRVFDALNNGTLASVDFTATDDDPYQLYDVFVAGNPARTLAVFNFLQPSSSQSPVDVTVDIYQTDGRLIRTLELPAVSYGDVSVKWDLRDAGGSLVPDGAYIYRINVHERTSGKETTSGGIVNVLKQ